MSNASEPTQKELHALLVNCPELRELERGLAGFNLFRVLRLTTGELRHSNVLAWLLRPEESHGLADLFLRRWLMRVLHDSEVGSDVAVADFDVAFFRSVDVFREWGSIDILVRLRLDDDEWVIAIENKINATQGWKQLDRYRTRVEAAFPNAKRVFVFLTLRDEEPADDRWLVADYRQVVEVLDDCVKERKDSIGHDPLVLISHFLRIIRELSMPDEKLIELARSIYTRHRRALDFIFDNQIDSLAQVTEALEKRMRDGATKALLTPMPCNHGFVRFMPATWDVAKNRAGRGWGDDGAFILCEIALRNAQPALKIVESKSPPAWRSQLFDIARADKATFNARAKMPDQWMTVYQHKMPNAPEDQDPDDAADAIWDAVVVHLADARFKKASAAVVAHINKLP